MAYDEGLADRIRVLLGSSGEFSERNMFGGLCFLVNERMCCGIVKNDLMLRLTPELAAAALGELHTRPMIYVDGAGIDSDSSLERWVRSAEQLARAAARGAATGATSSPKIQSRKIRSMARQLRLRIIVEGPPPGVDYALQKGSGSAYETDQRQRSQGKNLAFEFTPAIKDGVSDGWRP
jgi:TfoX/Sxy family transcriptional regulator of competence genes